MKTYRVYIKTNTGAFINKIVSVNDPGDILKNLEAVHHLPAICIVNFLPVLIKEEV